MCNATCIERKRDGGRKGGTTTYQRHGSGHMQKIGRHGFWMLAMKLGDGHCNRQAALYVLAGKGKLTPYATTPAQPWRGTR